MSENVAVVEQAIECLNKGDLDGHLAMYSPDAQFVGYPERVPPNVEGIRELYAALLAGITDLAIDVIDIFAAGARVALRYALTGHHEAELLGRARTGHAIVVEGLSILYFQDGKVVHHVNRSDENALLVQIGVIPTPSSTSG